MCLYKGAGCCQSVNIVAVAIQSLAELWPESVLTQFSSSFWFGCAGAFGPAPVSASVSESVWAPVPVLFLVTLSFSFRFSVGAWFGKQGDVNKASNLVRVTLVLV